MFDPVKVQYAHWIFAHFQQFFVLNRMQMKQYARASGQPSFPMGSAIMVQTRLRDYWQLAFNEDTMVIKNNLLEKMTDAELYDYAWRRFLAPYDKNLNREELLQRVSDYHKFLGAPFVTKGKAPNMHLVLTYTHGFYAEPGFLEGDISELEQNDFDHLLGNCRDVFQRRLEFENGVFRDQVEAHSTKILEDRKKQTAQIKA
jgi:hypothetical protein